MSAVAGFLKKNALFFCLFSVTLLVIVLGVMILGLYVPHTFGNFCPKKPERAEDTPPRLPSLRLTNRLIAWVFPEKPSEKTEGWISWMTKRACIALEKFDIFAFHLSDYSKTRLNNTLYFFNNIVTKNLQYNFNLNTHLENINSVNKNKVTEEVLNIACWEIIVASATVIVTLTLCFSCKKKQQSGKLKNENRREKYSSDTSYVSDESFGATEGFNSGNNLNVSCTLEKTHLGVLPASSTSKGLPRRLVRWTSVSLVGIVAVSIPWEFVRLYHKAVAVRATSMLKGVPPDCDPASMTFLARTWSFLQFQFSWGRGEDPCQQYHYALFVDPLWEITPALVVSSVITKCLLHPVELIFSCVGRSLRALLSEIPLQWQPLVILVATASVLLLLLSLARYRLVIPLLLRIEPRTPVSSPVTRGSKNQDCGESTTPRLLRKDEHLHCVSQDRWNGLSPHAHELNRFSDRADKTGNSLFFRSKAGNMYGDCADVKHKEFGFYNTSQRWGKPDHSEKDFTQIKTLKHHDSENKSMGLCADESVSDRNKRMKGSLSKGELTCSSNSLSERGAFRSVSSTNQMTSSARKLEKNMSSKSYLGKGRGKRKHNLSRNSDLIYISDSD